MFRYVVGLLVFLLVQIFSVECRILTTLPSLEVTDFIHGSSKSNENEDPVPVGTRWALLLAGSNGYENYRHQADICHAYQILKKGGLKDENIVVFMYDDMYAKDLNDVLKKKHELGTYKTLLFYLEACESGSIFEGLLPEDLNIIYATTASNSIESSWGTYCPGGYPGSTPEYDTCLGDLYIITWLEDSDTHNLQRETLEQQYEVGDAGTSQLPPAGPPQHSGGLLYRPVGPQTPPRASDHDHRLVIWVIVVVVVIAVVVAAVVATMVVAAVRWWRRRRATPAALEIEMPALPSYQRVLRQIGQDY